ncbi:probable Proline-specific permease [Zygosaccharomyces bailii ISA1307]|nr:probable Proline-specific permease [Zygosaccharomyces bailii ISA1307]
MLSKFLTDTKNTAGESSSYLDKKSGEVIEIDLESLSRQQSSSFKDEIEEVNANGSGELQAGLSARHIQLIALGGAIGTGLFVGTSSTLHTCGPAGLFISYCVISAVLYPIMNAFGEMVCFYPGNGNDAAGSMSYIVGRYVDPSLSFAVGWNYYYCFAILVAAECTAASGVVQYWTDAVPEAVWITIFIVVVFGLNMCAVKYYGETEFWFASLKILCIIGLIILSFILFWGGGPNHDRLGFRYWQRPGGFAHHVMGGSAGSFLDIYTGIIKGAFAFILGPELICLTSSESQDQRNNIAKASKRFIWRLIFFYILGSLSISVIVAYNDPALATALTEGKTGAGSSPFVIGIQNAGIKVLPHIINACILVSAWSAGNAFMFAASRSLLTLARNGQAPKIFARVNRFGVPWVAVCLTFLISCLGYLNVSSSSANVFTWLTNISTISGFLGWICGLIAYFRFRSAITFHNMRDRLPFKPWGQPWMAIWSLTIVSIITITNGYQTFIPRFWNVSDFIAAYITLPIFLVLWLGHKLWFRGWRQWWYPVDQIDVLTGIPETEEKARLLDEERIPPHGFWEKLLDFIC